MIEVKMSDGLSEGARDERVQRDVKKFLYQFRERLQQEGFGCGFIASNEALYEWNRILESIGLEIRRKR